MEASRTILVAGERRRERRLYVDRAGDHGTVRQMDEDAGAASVTAFLAAAAQRLTGSPVLDVREALPLATRGVHVTLWEPCGADARWRTTRLLGTLQEGAAADTPTSRDGGQTGAPDVTVLFDTGGRLRLAASADAWPAAVFSSGAATEDGWLVVETERPLAAGDLWRAVVGSRSDRLAVLVSAEDLRRDGVPVPRPLSWEQSAGDLLRALRESALGRELLRARYLVVRFGTDGALIVDRDGEAARLVFDPSHLEGDREGEIPGSCTDLDAAFAAGFAAALAFEPNPRALPRAVRAALAAVRCLHRIGHGPAGEAPVAPFDVVAQAFLAPRDSLGEALVPSDALRRRGWSIVAERHGVSGEAARPLVGIARRVARFGLGALEDVPCDRFGQLLRVERSEIESLRNLRQLMQSYQRSGDGRRPLCVAVFGPPGSGKSFGVKQIGKAVLGKETPVLTFNLSEFEAREEVIAALHAVRDKVLEGRTPLVFWDEFDSQRFAWLQHFLAPMQDGQFRSGQSVHTVGKCVFVFAGGTAASFAAFGPPEGDARAQEEFRLKKGPDFTSRLDGYLDVLGPNPCDGLTASEPAGGVSRDVSYPLRRALQIRGNLGLEDGVVLDIDEGLLSALLEVPRYLHGARSLSRVLEQLGGDGKKNGFRRGDLPPAERLAMQVDARAFEAILDRDRSYDALTERLAPAVHDFYLAHARRLGWTPAYDMPYDALPADIRADNIAAAQRVPTVLGLLGLYVVPGEGGTRPEVRDVIERHVETLAMAEHEGWRAHKLRNGWRFGTPRDDAARIHDRLMPFRDLPDRPREGCRDSVRCYAAILEQVGFTISESPV